MKRGSFANDLGSPKRPAPMVEAQDVQASTVEDCGELAHNSLWHGQSKDAGVPRVRPAGETMSNQDLGWFIVGAVLIVALVEWVARQLEKWK